MNKGQIKELSDIVGSLMISQFKGKNKQEEYREVINQIFYFYFKNLKTKKENE